jgi:thiol-disulfide isomerase/thioredoxin
MKKKALIFLFFVLFPAFLWAQDNGRSIPEGYLKDPEKPVLLMFTATWCGPCQMLKVNTFKHPDVAPLLSQVNLLLMDIDTAEGKKYQKAYGCDREGIPHLILMDKDQTIVAEKGGYSKDVTPFVEFLNKALKPEHPQN